MKNVFQLGVVGDVEVPSHSQLRASVSRSERRKIKEFLGDIPKQQVKKPKQPKKKKLVYADYIKSKAWRGRRSRYFSKFGKKCAVCSSKYNIGVHHLSYEKLGDEPDGHLVALCWNCHSTFHDEYGRGKQEKQNTYTFIKEQQEIEELRQLKKHL